MKEVFPQKDDRVLHANGARAPIPVAGCWLQEGLIDWQGHGRLTRIFPPVVKLSSARSKPLMGFRVMDYKKKHTQIISNPV